ncbi:hypothetical protein [Aestuariivita sp.]|jgi:hypothetical protein|uniref:hypothetical protein n=1 Tax=Aestuariivita sp. TaxID=1872407 RepID=UPI0025C5A8E4|nr:hypothetical protein [Aestuariivita sp.]
MVAEQLREDAETIQAEGWKWVEVGTDFPYGHTYGMGRIVGDAEPMSDEEQKSYEALKAEYQKLEDDYAEADDLPEEVDERLGEIETAMEALQDRPVRFEEEERTISGTFVSIDGSGRLCSARPSRNPVLQYSGAGQYCYTQAAPWRMWRRSHLMKETAYVCVRHIEPLRPRFSVLGAVHPRRLSTAFLCGRHRRALCLHR